MTSPIKIIKLTDSRNKELVLINLDHVVSVLGMDSYTNIMFCTGTTLSVYETPEEIATLIDKIAKITPITH